MDQNEYPRPNYVSSDYPADKTWGIVIIVLSALGICAGLAAGAVGGLVGTAGAAGAATSNTQDGAAAGAAIGAGGGILAMLGIFIALVSVAQLVGGVGVMKSQRWGFLVTGGFALLSFVMNIFRLPAGILGLIISGVILYYCYSRLTGKKGPVPV